MSRLKLTVFDPACTSPSARTPAATVQPIAHAIAPIASVRADVWIVLDSRNEVSWPGHVSLPSHSIVKSWRSAVLAWSNPAAHNGDSSSSTFRRDSKFAEQERFQLVAGSDPLMIPGGHNNLHNEGRRSQRVTVSTRSPEATP